MGLLGSAALSFKFAASAEGNQSDKKEVAIVVNLNKSSVETLKAFLVERRKISRDVVESSTPRYVCIKNAADTGDIHIYEPLFGERVVFRLQGLVETKPPGGLVAVGKISSMVGEIAADDFVGSLPVVPHDPRSKEVLQCLQDLPTRLFRLHGLREKTFWQGIVPAGIVQGRSYPSQEASYTSLPKIHQILLEGRICSSEFANEDGNCNFDRATLVPAAASEEESSPASPPSPSSEVVEEGGGTAEECPLCKFVKAGPCKDPFVEWNGCMSSLTEQDEMTKCFATTAAMMRCMRNEDYYDVMVYGMDFSKLDAIDRVKAEIVSTSTASNQTAE
eukprot:gene24711-33184_t